MDKYDLSLTDEADIQAVKDKANSYADRLNNGESFIDIRYEVDLAEAQDEAAVEAENAFEDETFEAPTEEEFDAAINEAIAGATAEKYENDADVETVISKEYSSLDVELTEYIWNLAADDKATVFETEKASYVVVKHDITTKEYIREEYRDTILHELKGDEFEALLETTGAAYAVELNEKLVNKYSPDTYKGFKKDEEE